MDKKQEREDKKDLEQKHLEKVHGGVSGSGGPAQDGPGSGPTAPDQPRDGFAGDLLNGI